MAWLRKALIAVLVIALVLLVLVFSLNNQAEVALDFLFYETPAYGVAFWLVSAFILGLLVGAGLTSVAMLRSGFRRRQLERRLQKAEKS